MTTVSLIHCLVHWTTLQHSEELKDSVERLLFEVSIVLELRELVDLSEAKAEPLTNCVQNKQRET